MTGTHNTEEPQGSSTKPGMQILNRAVGMALCVALDAARDPTGSARMATVLLRRGDSFIARGAIMSGLKDHDDAYRILDIVRYLEEPMASPSLDKRASRAGDQS